MNPNDSKLERMSADQLRAALREVYAVLYADGPNTEWDADTVTSVVDVLAEYGLGPPAE